MAAGRPYAIRGLVRFHARTRVTQDDVDSALSQPGGYGCTDTLTAGDERDFVGEIHEINATTKARRREGESTETKKGRVSRPALVGDLRTIS